ncbi:energy-coupling factor transporter transmembrane component T [Vagococcus jeotgali]|uniref:energy-coupling factor transporter transmembrane component T n=1 Tax=Vagococcus jeotgali TaxID=3109030 RepID=UPI002DDA4082|nr:energy-coupling factor transporter transmembrane component T [Vagococcus sp. B2T-5]
MTHQYISFDPRSKLATVIFASFLLISRASQIIELAFMLFICLLLTLNGAGRKGLFLISTYVCLMWVTSFFLQSIKGPISAFFSFILVAYLMLLPPVTAGIFATVNVSVGQWVSAMKKWHIPNWLIIPFVVVCRFFPVIKQDFKDIKQAMKLRGIGLSVWETFLHPVQTLEYIIVPLLMAVEKSAQDLSASALVRGLGNEGAHTSIYETKFKVQDYILLGCLFCFVIFEGAML